MMNWNMEDITNTLTEGGGEVLDRLGAEHRKIFVVKLDVNKQKRMIHILKT